jgi:hypothetical protein
MARTVRGVRCGLSVMLVFGAAMGSAIGEEPIANVNVRTESSGTDQQAMGPRADKHNATAGENRPSTSSVSPSRRLTLRNGSVIEGTVVELSPKISITLLLSSGEVRTTRWEDIEKEEETAGADDSGLTAVGRSPGSPSKSARERVGPVPQSNDQEDSLKQDRPDQQLRSAKVGAGFLYSRMLSTSFYLGSLDVKLGWLIVRRVELMIGPRIAIGQTASGNTVTMINPLTFSVGARWLKRFYTGAAIHFLDLIVIDGPSQRLIWPSFAGSVDARIQLFERTQGALALFVQPGVAGTLIENLPRSDRDWAVRVIPRFLLSVGLGYIY